MFVHGTSTGEKFLCGNRKKSLNRDIIEITLDKGVGNPSEPSEIDYTFNTMMEKGECKNSETEQRSEFGEFAVISKVQTLKDDIKITDSASKKLEEIEIPPRPAQI